MKSKLLLTLFFMVGLTTYVFSQSITVSGTVKDKEGGGLPGVTILIKGTTQGTATNNDGTYTLADVPSNATLIFSFVGMQTQEIVVGAQTSIDVVLQEEGALAQVVVTAFGIKKEKKALSYAVQEVKADAITAVDNPNLSNALQGKAAGVQLRQTSGMPGASSLITVRGNSSLTGNNQPLFVVDGVPISSTSDFTPGVSGTDGSSRSLDINPNDIESVSILKGGAASALYGLRASNGVVLITTKSGKNAKKGRTNITLNTGYTWDRVTRLPKAQKTYAQGSARTFNPGTSLSWGPKISQLGDPNVNPNATGNGTTYINNVGQEVTGQAYDNVSPLFQTGGTYNLGVSASAATAKGHYAVGFGYTKQEGILPTTGMRRINGKVAGGYQLTTNLKVEASLNFSDLLIDKVAGGSNLSNPLFTTYWAPSSYDLWGTPYAEDGNPYKQIHYRGAMDNPRWSLANNQFDETNRRAFGNVQLTYKPLKWLTVNYRLGNDFYVTGGKEVYELGSGGTGGRTTIPSGGQIQDYTFTSRQVNSNLTLILNQNFGKDFSASLLLGNEFYDIRTQSLSVVGTGITIGGFRNMSNTSNQVTTEISTAQRVVGFFSNFELSWRNTLFLTASGRQDYVSYLARNNRRFFYPSVGVSWAFTETFEVPQNILTFGKIRLNYAQVGSGTAPYSTTNIFIQGNPNSGFLTDGIAYPFNGQVGFTQSNIIRNENLRPQNTVTYEVGTELKFLNNRISLDYSYYVNNTTDQIFSVPVPGSTGFTSETRNAGEVETKGHELAVNAQIIQPAKQGGFGWNLGVNFTSFSNRVIRLEEGVANIFLAGFTTPSSRAFAGRTYPSLFGVGYQRDDQGRVVVDGRGDANTNATYGMPIADPNPKVIGNVQPDFTMAITNSFSFKGFTLTTQIDWRKGGQAYSGNTRLARLYGQTEETEDRESTSYVVPDAVSWNGEVDASGNPVYTNLPNNNISIARNQTYWVNVLSNIDEAHVFDAGFVRLREVALTYQFPSAWLKRLKLNTLSLSVIGRNLLLFTNYPGFDPETNLGGAINGQGLEYVSLPQTKSYGVSLKTTF
ncbi:SusC/RagA family TonB-linked outer membrane protein [Microscilla marina]|uniref:Outer membrane protein n=1 Tax=Microscilla marina ATCC 23134 TaxID=313606 RepID=A1ZF81_MICM2|nr:SusC/RagA family TonB-linked outer membrane protein [Microscilla marina]EAY31183.1 outer membrane protein [Microscilla marina ATCC 23134]